EDPAASRVEVDIDVASVRTDSDQRDGHLLSPDFFDADNYAQIRFASTKVEPVDGDTWNLHGDLTIKDVTRPVTLTFEYLGVLKDPWGNDKAAFSAFTEVDREQWGLTWNAALETGGVLVGKQVRLEFEIQAQLAA
ncbi:MAG TPA: YceI family protein, partial [Egibacteraceae bacterium]|nr:YceI family protein [Egibacteraceae bacterium]